MIRNAPRAHHEHMGQDLFGMGGVQLKRCRSCGVSAFRRKDTSMVFQCLRCILGIIKQIRGERSPCGEFSARAMGVFRSEWGYGPSGVEQNVGCHRQLSLF